MFPTLYNYDHDTGLWDAVPAAAPHGAPAAGASLGGQYDHEAIDFGADGDDDAAAFHAAGGDDEYETLAAAPVHNSQSMVEQFRASGAVHLLQISSADICNVVVLIPACHAASRSIGTAAVAAVSDVGQEARANPFATVTICPVHCKDGITFCNDCTNPGCSRERRDDEKRAMAMQHPQQLHATIVDVFGSAEPFCRCMAAAVHTLWPDGLDKFMEWLSMQEPYVARHMQLDNFGAGGRSYRVIYAPDNSRSHSDWGFVRRVETSDDTWECLSCDRNKGSCAHVSAWPGSDARTMSDAAFERHLAEFLDPNKGERRLTCVSRTRIPEDLEYGERAAEWAGLFPG